MSLLPFAMSSPLLDRPRLLQSLRARPAARLVLVHAPAGFGKSSLLEQLRQSLQAEGLACALLALEPADNDPSRFVARLRAALDLEGVTPQALLENLARREEPFTLLLDDVEHLQDPGLLALLRELLIRLPAQGQLVLSGRGRPDLGPGLSLSRMRLHGELLELGLEALRFSADETVAYLAAQPALELPPEGAQQLHLKTEGWPAGLAMAAAVLQRLPAGNDFMRQLCASDQALATYLSEAVLDQLGFETQQLLLRASILRRLEPALCERLLPGCDARRLLQGLAREGFLLTSIAQEPDECWRMHALFAEVLGDRLRRRQPELALRLHLTAGACYEAQGRFDAAIEHAIEGGDLPYAIELLRTHAERFLAQGRMRWLARWLARLPESQVDAEPVLRVASLWAQALQQGPQGAWGRLLALQGRAQQDWERLHLAALRLLLLAMLDRYEDAVALGAAWPSSAVEVSPFALAVGSNAQAHVWAVAGLFGGAGGERRALPLLEQARGLLAGPALRFTQGYTEAVAGAIDLHEGRLSQAGARLHLAAEGGPSTGAAGAALPYNHAHGNVWAGVLYAAYIYETGQLPQARALLQACLPLVRELALPDHMLLALGLQARVAFELGEVDTALALLQELESLGLQRQLPRVVAGAHLERAWLRLRQGRTLAAQEEIAQADVDGVWERVAVLRLPAHDLEDLAIARWRYALAFEDEASVRAHLPAMQAALALARQQGRGRRALKLQLLWAVALQHAGEWARALEELRDLLPRLARDGYRRLVLDEGPALLLPLLNRLQTELQREARVDPLVADYVQGLLQALAAMAAPSGSAPEQDLALTRQELRVLQLVAEGYSNGAMAEKLSVSDSTVRTHLRSIYQKLGAQSRGQALAIARRLAVLK